MMPCFCTLYPVPCSLDMSDDSLPTRALRWIAATLPALPYWADVRARLHDESSLPKLWPAVRAGQWRGHGWHGRQHRGDAGVDHAWIAGVRPQPECAARPTADRAGAVRDPVPDRVLPLLTRPMGWLPVHDRRQSRA